MIKKHAIVNKDIGLILQKINAYYVIKSFNVVIHVQVMITIKLYVPNA